ncbi:hypothetical protein CSUI_007253 [Cystoisospora suis]|uniref:Uncharacterized protein n=1 Tax=Cystoisospora suis TaxID=483139 RepID=A0A2C6KRL1_9APIC|nr:hypothetical protein CSUI_007253 [Cystoisospora suis]
MLPALCAKDICRTVYDSRSFFFSRSPSILSPLPSFFRGSCLFPTRVGSFRRSRRTHSHDLHSDMSLEGHFVDFSCY